MWRPLSGRVMSDGVRKWLRLGGVGRRQATGDGSRVVISKLQCRHDRTTGSSSVLTAGSQLGASRVQINAIGCRVFPVRGEEFERYMVPAGKPRSRSSYRELLVRPKSAARRIVFPSPPKARPEPARAHREPYCCNSVRLLHLSLACEGSH